MKGLILGLSIFLQLGIVSLRAQQKKNLTLDDVWKSPVWRSDGIEDLNWFKSGSQYSTLKEGNIEVFDVKTGSKVRTLVEGKELKVDTSVLDIQNYTLSPDENQVLIETDIEPIYRRSSRAYFFLYNLTTKSLQAIFPGKKVSLASFSPDGKWVAFCFENNLYLQDVATGKVRPVTQTGKANALIHGSSDWVYEEEFEYWKAFHWSPDSKKIAFLSFDELQVPTYNMQLWTGLYPKDYTFKYPKAGEKNSKVDLSVFDLATGRTLSIEEGSENDQYIARMQWTKNPNLVSVRRMNRLQNKIDLLHIDATNGAVQTVFTETSPTFFEINDALTYLDNGKEFVYSTDKSGYQHLYLYGMDGKLIRPITSGNWEVADFFGVDEKKGLIYFLSTEDASIQK
jgi:dipeptidyl-peptidase-4